MSKEHVPFLVKIVGTDQEDFLQSIQEGILLISSSVAAKMKNNLNLKRTVILNEGELDKCFEEFYIVDKYQSAEMVYQQLIECYLNREDICISHHGSKSQKQVEVIGVYSPTKRIGKTGFIYQRCAKQARSKKVLLISLEEFSKTKDEGEGLSELIYFYKKGKLKSGIFPQHLICQEGAFDRIRPVRWVFDLKDMTGDDWCDLVTQLGSLDVYDSIWLDFDGMPVDIRVFEICNTVYVPYVSQENELRRVEQFEEMISAMSETSLLGRIQKVPMDQRREMV